MADDGTFDEEVRVICREHVHSAGPLLPILHAVQVRFGYISKEAQATVAHELNLSRAEVHGVVSFYADFRAAPPKTHVLKVCRAEACQAVGGRAVWEAASTVGSDVVEVEPVYCLGNCACAPSAQLDGRTLGRIDPAHVRMLIRECGEQVAS